MSRRANLIALLALGVACAYTPVHVETRNEMRIVPDVDATRLFTSQLRIPESQAYQAFAWDPAYFDLILPSNDLEISGLRSRHHREGVGIPLVGVREVAEDDPFYYPPEGITRPLTAITLSSERGAMIQLLDPTRVRAVRISGEERPLAADFTAPYAVLLSRTTFERSAVSGTLDYKEIEERVGIFLLEPYDPDRIPLLMVHGLLSSPLTWMELTNELMGDALARDHFQIWHAIYPTGIPFLHAAADFRDQLARLRSVLDPDGDDYASNHMVVVAHSKGGLLTKTLVSSSGDALWNSVFTVPPEALKASPEDLAAMRRFLFFRRDPGVRRVVFIATPHRGSRLADNALARFLASWVSLPKEDSETFVRVLRENEQWIAPDFRFRLAGLPSGPRALSDEDPLIRTLGDLPVDAQVPFHTVVGALEPGLLSDGVVDHESSYQEGATSELVVEGEGHGVHSSPAAIAEVLRILHEHLAAEVAPRPGPDESREQTTE